MIGIVPGDTETVHPRVQLQVDTERDVCRIQAAGVVHAHHGLDEVMTGEQGGLSGVRPAQHQNITPDPLQTQTDALVCGGDGEGVYALGLAGAADQPVAVAVGVGLDHRHEAAVPGEVLPQGGDIVLEGGHINLRPGPRPGLRVRRRGRGPGAPPPPEQEGQCGEAGGGHYRQIVDQAVSQQEAALRQKAQGLADAAHPHDAQGMYDIDHGGECAQSGERFNL